jgi:hypothetical protein
MLGLKHAFCYWQNLLDAPCILHLVFSFATLLWIYEPTRASNLNFIFLYSCIILFWSDLFGHVEVFSFKIARVEVNGGQAFSIYEEWVASIAISLPVDCGNCTNHLLFLSMLYKLLTLYVFCIKYNFTCNPCQKGPNLGLSYLIANLAIGDHHCMFLSYFLISPIF